jgi:uncharacterized protein
MPSDYESFWQFETYAVVGHSARHPFPRLTYNGLKSRGKKAYAVDATVTSIDGDPTYAELGALPGPVDAVVLEVPSDESQHWIQQAINLGVKDVWLHAGTDSPEALALAKEHKLHVRSGTCAVMYLNRGFSPHAIHGFIMKLRGKY